MKKTVWMIVVVIVSISIFFILNDMYKTESITTSSNESQLIKDPPIDQATLEREYLSYYSSVINDLVVTVGNLREIYFNFGGSDITLTLNLSKEPVAELQKVIDKVNNYDKAIPDKFSRSHGYILNAVENYQFIVDNYLFVIEHQNKPIMKQIEEAYDRANKSVMDYNSIVNSTLIGN
jgi:hypothetical protein